MFKFKTYLPTQKRYAYSRQMTSKEYMSIVKTIQNNDVTQIKREFYNLIYNCYDITTNPKKLNQIDIFCMLLNLRIMSVSDNLVLVYAGNGDVNKNIKLDLYDILDKATNCEITYNNEYETELITILTTTPRGLVSDSVAMSILTHVDYIKNNKTGEKYKFKRMSTEQIDRFLDSIPVGSVKRMMKEIQDNDNKFDLEIVGKLGDEMADIRLNLYDNSMYNTLKLCYNSNLPDLYNLRYIMFKRCNMDVNYIETIAPIELETYFSLFKQELAEEKKGREKASGTSGNVQLPAQNFTQL